MKNNKKLVVLAGAAALGLVAATGVTSGFAWFAVNSQVTATSLTIKAKSNGAYLLIDTTDNAAANAKGTSALTKDVAPVNVPEVYPCAYTTTAINWDGPDGVADNTDDVTISANSWYTGTIDDKTQATGDWTSLKSVTLGESDYFASYNFYLTLATGSEDYSGAIGVKATFNLSEPAAKAVVVFGSENQEILSNADANSAKHNYAGQTLTATRCTSIKRYHNLTPYYFHNS